MAIYSFLLTVALLLSAPWWLWRLFTSGRYRAGLRQRMGWVPPELIRAVHGRKTIWLHAVSVGEVLAATTLVNQLQAALPDWVIAISTTTSGGNQVAREKFPGCPVFYLPLDYAYTVLRFLGVIRPQLLVLLESEFWPRLLSECHRANIPVVVANARISDRSYPRYLRLRRLWRPLLAKVSVFLAQGDESAERLLHLGVPLDRIRMVGNLKYDAPVPGNERMIALLRRFLPADAEVVVCGSTLDGEELQILDSWVRLVSTGHRGVLILAPRHPQRFESVSRLAGPNVVRASEWSAAPRPLELGEILILDTLGDLATVYEVASVAVVGGSLVPKGGHNPLEPARFGVPVVMGPSYENFREIVEAMRELQAIYIVEDRNLTLCLHQAMSRGRAVGRRGREYFHTQAGATARTVAAIVDLLPPDLLPRDLLAKAPSL